MRRNVERIQDREDSLEETSERRQVKRDILGKTGLSKMVEKTDMSRQGQGDCY